MEFAVVTALMAVLAATAAQSFLIFQKRAKCKKVKMR